MRKITLAVSSIIIVVSLAMWTVLAAGTSTPPKDAKYVGTKECRSCHLKEYKSWKATKHAKAFKILEGPELKDPDCLRCHTTGYGKPGGFTSEKETPRLKSVGCESCHGPSSAHNEAAKVAPEKGKWDTKINKVPQNACVKCHNPHISQKKRVAELRAKRKTG